MILWKIFCTILIINSMIHKSYLIEDNIDLLKNKFSLFYGENLGLKNEFKIKLKKKFKKKIISFHQEEILKNQNIFLNEINNKSLFEDEKYFFIDEANDKILELIEKIIPNIENNRIYLFSNILDKRSKLRSYFEKDRNCDVIACYKDTELSFRKLISKKLKDYSVLTPDIVNLLIDNSSLDRVKLNNELDKITSYFVDKKIQIDELDKLLNTKIDEEFSTLKDTAMKGNRNLTNKLLGSTIIENEKIPLYINMINQRLNKLRELLSISENKRISDAVNEMKPPIFWKDKDNFLNQAKLWDKKKISIALEKTYNFEIDFKSNSITNKIILVKKLLLDICVLATA